MNLLRINFSVRIKFNFKGGLFIINKIGDQLKKKIKNYQYHKDREVYLKSVVANIGKIIEEDDKIICYVDQELLDKYGKGNSSIYHLRLNGVILFPEETKKLLIILN